MNARLLALPLFAVPLWAQAEHVSFGAGCHDVARESFAAWFPDAPSAAAALHGQSLRLLPAAGGYAVVWGGASYCAPSAAAVALPPNDDGQTAIVPTQPLPTPLGPWSTLYVHSNGFVAAAAANDGGAWNVPANDYWPSAAYRDAPAAAFWAWHDWNPAEPGSGRIVHEEVWLGGERTLCVTWRDVENFPVGLANRGTFQFQFGLATGRVAYVWVEVDADAASPFGTAHLVGWSPGGPSLDPGWLAVPGGLPLATAPDLRAVALVAAPAPVSNAAAGTTIAYTTGHAPPLAAGSEQRLGTTVLSLHGAPGIELGALGPGCRVYVQSLDVSLPWVAATPIAAAPFEVPAGLPDGLEWFAQSAVLVDAGAAGLQLRTSNGVQSRIGAH